MKIKDIRDISLNIIQLPIIGMFSLATIISNKTHWRW